MANLDSLRSHGWHITSEGLNNLTENESIVDIRNVTRRALDVDIRDFGSPIIATEINKTTFGPVNLQIIKVRNISAPKSKPNSQGAPRMLKLILTDGHTNCQGIEVKQIPSLSLDKTVPGTKIFINGAPVLSGSILLNPENCKVLGGSVTALVEKWELSKLMPSHIRHNEDGPPPWVNFGKKIVNTIDNRGFKSLENKNKDNTKENAEFQNQRQDAIMEATQGAVKKVFGGGVKPAQTFNSYDTNSNNYNNNPQRAPRQPRGKNRDRSEPEKMEKPSQRVSLFDFLEDKLSLNDNNQSKFGTTTNKVFNNDVPTPRPKEYFDNTPRSKEYFDNTPRPKPEYFDNTPRPKEYFDSTPRPKPEYFDNNTPRNKFQMNSSTQKPTYREPNKFKPPQNSYTNPNTYNNAPRQDFENKVKIHQSENRFQNDKPPRFQKHKQESSSKFGNVQSEPRLKPNTNIFVDKLANEMNNISLYNSKYENEKLRQPNRVQENSSKPWKWKVGDKCMAKYWEDDKFYNAVVTGITHKTCMVEFLEYGNFEEVLHCDCIPITTEKEDRKHSNRYTNDNQDFSGSIEFRRGKNRPYVGNGNKPPGQNKTYDS